MFSTSKLRKPKKPKKPKKRKKKKMVDLIDRMTFGSEEIARPKISNHQFNAHMRLYSLGLRSRQEISDSWDLQGDEAVQAGTFADKIDSITGNDAKIAYVLQADAVSMLLDMQHPDYVTASGINKTRVFNDLGW